MIACDFCSNESVGVFASQLGPISFAKCQTCLDNGAEHESTLRISEILTPDSAVYEENKKYITIYVDGRYLTLEQYRDIRDSRDHLFEETLKATRKIAAINAARNNDGT